MKDTKLRCLVKFPSLHLYSTNYRAASEAECQSDISDMVYPASHWSTQRSHGNALMTGHFVTCPKSKKKKKNQQKQPTELEASFKKTWELLGFSDVF